MDDKSIEIKFGGDLEEIDVDLLIEALTNYSIVAQETASYLSPSIKVNIKIKAPQRGSFIVLLDLIAKNSGDLFTRENVAVASEIFTLVGGLYAFKKWISKNGNAEVIKQVEDNSIEIQNNQGKIVIDQRVFNIYQETPRVRENLRRTFEKLKETEEIEDFTITDSANHEEIFKASKEEFDLMSSSIDEIEKKRQVQIKEDQELAVFKLVFQENYKWEFYWLGNKVYASLSDEEFFSKIKKGEIAFRNGDRLIVDIAITQVFNEAANTFVNEKYDIVKVKEHIPRTSETQSLLNFDTDDKN